MPFSKVITFANISHFILNVYIYFLLVKRMVDIFKKYLFINSRLYRSSVINNSLNFIFAMSLSV